MRAFAHLAASWVSLLILTGKLPAVTANQDHLQLVDRDGRLIHTDQIHQALSRWDLHNVGTDYSVVSIEGPQSSGKSFLLNHLFGTDFQVMGPTRRQQTTQGIWMGVAQGAPIIVLDAEGSDSRERRVSGDVSSERKTLAFTLAHSDVVIINIWAVQVGLYRGANLELLQSIFEQNLKLFRGLTDPPKKVLLFLLRDDNHETHLHELKRVLQESLESVWSAVPNGGARLYEYFAVEVASLPSPIHDVDGFAAAVHQLKSWFHNGQGGLFRGRVAQNIPVDALPEYMQMNHAAIEADEDMNLPSHRELVQEYRINAMAADIRVMADERLSEVKGELAAGNHVEGLGQLSRDILDASTEHFMTSTKGYKTSLRDEHLNRLRADILQSLKSCYTRNINNLTRHLRSLLASMSDDYAVYSSRDTIISSFEQAQISGALEGDWIDDTTKQDLVQLWRLEVESAERSWGELLNHLAFIFHSY